MKAITRELFIVFIECLQCVQFSSLSCVWLFVTPWTAAHQASLSITQLPEFTQTHVHRVSDAIQPSHPLSSPSPTFNLSQHQDLFKWVSSLHRRPKVLEFQLHHLSFNEYSGLISFRMDWLDLLAIQGTCKSLLQHHSSKALFFGAQLSSQSNSHIHTWPQEKP